MKYPLQDTWLRKTCDLTEFSLNFSLFDFSLAVLYTHPEKKNFWNVYIEMHMSKKSVNV